MWTRNCYFFQSDFKGGVPPLAWGGRGPGPLSPPPVAALDWKSQNSISSDHFKAGCYRKGKKRLHDNAKPSDFMSKSEKKIKKSKLMLFSSKKCFFTC